MCESAEDMDPRGPGVLAPQRGQQVTSGLFSLSEFDALCDADISHMEFPTLLPRHRSNPVAPAPSLASFAMDVRTVSGAATTHRTAAEVDVRFVAARAVRACAAAPIFD